MKAYLLALIALTVLFLPCHAEGGRDVDVALVLAIDSSGSVDEEEFALQLTGIARAFRNPEVIATAISGSRRRIAVNLMVWSDAGSSKSNSGWFEIGSIIEAERFATRVEAFRRSQKGFTGIGSAIREGLRLIATSGFRPARKVIDISGDGVETLNDPQADILLPAAHLLRERAGVVVNGLAVTVNIPDLDSYYRQSVIGGAGSFVIEANDYHDYTAAIRMKLLRELRPLTAAATPAPLPRPEVQAARR
jgi:hypothetical protein